MVCVNVTIEPRNNACFSVPRLPTRYAATMVLPCPGDSAWIEPKPKATNRPNRMVPSPNFRSRSMVERKSPRTTAPGPADCCSVNVRELATGKSGAAGAGTGTSRRGIATRVIRCSVCRFGIPSVADQRADAARSCGGASVRSAGYAVNSWLMSRSECDVAASATPSPLLITISFQPVRFA